MAVLGASVSVASALTICGLFFNSEQVYQNTPKMSDTESVNETYDMLKKGDKANKRDFNDVGHDFPNFAPQMSEIRTDNNNPNSSGSANVNNKIEPHNNKNNVSNEPKNAPNINKKGTANEIVDSSNPKVKNFDQNLENKIEASEVVETESTKELRMALEQIESHLPVPKPTNNNTINSYFKKRDLLVREVEQFLNGEKVFCLNRDARCEELLAKIKELSTEISTYHEIIEHIKELNKISDYIDKSKAHFEEVSNQPLPTIVNVFKNKIVTIQNGYYLTNFFDKVKKIIQDPTILPSSDANSCENLIKENQNLINKFKSDIRDVNRRYSSSRRSVDFVIKKLTQSGNCSAPRPCGKADEKAQ